MDKQSLFSNHLFVNNNKLTKTVSFSELSIAKKMVIEQQDSNEHGNLFKQYSCEQIYDKSLNTSHLKISRTFKSDNEEYVDMWDNIIPGRISLTNSTWTNRANMPLRAEKQISSTKECVDPNRSNQINSKQIIIPPKFIFEKNSSNQLHTNNINNFYNNHQFHKENYNNSLFEFKKPTLLNKNLNLLRNIDNNIVDSCNVNKNNISELLDSDTSDVVEKLKVDSLKLKRKLRPLLVKSKRKKKITNYCYIFLCILLIPIVISLFVKFFLMNVELSNEICNPHFQFQNIVEDLRNHIHGQENAISDLTRYFMNKENQTGFDVIGLIGETGVGKSYTADIINNNLKDIYNTLDFYHQFDNKRNEAYTSLSLCQCNLIRLENIKTNDIIGSINFISNLKKQTNNYYCILILAIFNTQVTDDNLKKIINLNKTLTEIDEKFQENDLNATLVSFTTLSDETLIKCIEEAANYFNRELSKEDVILVKNDLLNADSGCKGAHAKVQLVGKLKELTDV